MTLMTEMHAMGGLPDPVSEARFYDGVSTRRFFAFFIDEAIGWTLGLVVALIFGITTLGLGFFAAAPVMAATAFVYRWASIGLWSATPAMRLFGIEFRSIAGDRFNSMQALFHTGIFYLCWATGIGQIISVGMMIATPMGRGAPDMLLGSAAIHSPA